MTTIHSSFTKANDFHAPDLDAFKTQCKIAVRALSDRGVSTKLSDMLEAMARAYGFTDFATYHGIAKKTLNRTVATGMVDLGQYTQYLMLSPDDIDCQDIPADFAFIKMIDAVRHPDLDALGNHALPYQLNQILGRNDYPSQLLEGIRIIPKGHSDGIYTEEFIVQGALCQTPRVERYGIPIFACEQTFQKTVMDLTDMRVQQYPSVEVVDTGDDSAGITLFMVAIPNEMCKLIEERAQDYEI